MSNAIAELDVVRVVSPLKEGRQYSGTNGISRSPRVGDLATVVHVLEAGRAFIVEAVDADGYTLWVADFLAEELALELSVVQAPNPSFKRTPDGAA